MPSFIPGRNDPVEDVTAKTTNVRSSAAAVTLWKVVWAGGAKVASALPVTESPTTTPHWALPICAVGVFVFTGTSWSAV
jgi:hypothetical protein